MLLDLELPDVHGFEVCRRLRAEARNAHCAVIFVTAHADHDNELAALDVGGVDFIHKPINMPVARARVETQLRLRRQLDALHRSQADIQAIIDHVPALIGYWDAELRNRFANSAYTPWFGLPPSQIRGKHLREVIGDVRFIADSPHIQGALRGESQLFEREVLTPSGEVRFGQVSLVPDVREGRVHGFFALMTDITARRQAEQALHDNARLMASRIVQLAERDALTDLPNRTLINVRLGNAILRAQQDGYRFAVLVLDVDRFQYVNDSQGHATGDLLLQAMAERLSLNLRAADMVGRPGGDEFVILLEHADSDEMVVQVADKLLAAVSAPYEIDGKRFDLTFSMGICLYPDDGQDHETLMSRADAALHRAKAAGRNRYQFYVAEIGDLILARHALERHLRDAMDQQLFTVHYQPQIDAGSRRIVGVEALVRWVRADGQLVPPAQFVPLAEECGLIVPLGKFVLREACRQARAWNDAGLPPMRMAVNIAASQFVDKGFVEMVTTTLAQTGLPASQLELEITEGTLLIDAQRTRAVLDDLKRLGISIAIDDFGTGYSSLSYLKRFPIDVLKIDQSFVRDVLTDPSDAAIVSAIIKMAQSLRLDLVAEGVEREAQFHYLRAEGCEVMQGYYFSRPGDARTITDFIRDWLLQAA
ncbi:putative bifunctional diguanylate cyclase/phosphodiesterase [Chitinimonas koreensis]|uniref:putative bifunctional diguanylate cyclase/phosphodiesterase n=1 Tax=Chitinimonas koreensis TaxID=356302 RepID=UPI0016546C6D|nr:EAL domain-containing protein [Chitinimonas koreensis]QNM95404.1 EAL domain-containing protein [Chitinimonas koreensis]